MRTPLTSSERLAAAITVAGVVVIGGHGLRTGAAGTVQYLLVVAALSCGLDRLRTEPLPASLAVALAVVACAHLAGGLVRVGDGVLYNADPGLALFQYDHLVHAAATFVGTLTLWELFVRDRVAAPGRGLVMVGVLAGLGLGALNETIEFLATLSHGGAHVGGYENTGWDLVTNSTAGAAAGVALSLRTGGSPHIVDAR